MRLGSVLFAFTLVGSAFGAVLGIDYGEQHIKAMVVSPQAPMELVLTPEAKRKEISGLAIRNRSKDEIERIYGSAVGSLATRFPNNVFLHLKTLLGKTIEDKDIINAYLEQHPGVNIVSTKRNSLAFDIDGKQYSVEELVAMNLQEIAHRANAMLQEKDPRTKDFVDKFAIAIPEFYDQNQRLALIDAGSFIEKAYGTYLVNDGLSVAINYALKQRDFTPGEENHFMIYDIGSGSIKTSLISISQPINETEPLQIDFEGFGYNELLGGSKLTNEIAKLIETKFLEKNPKITKSKLKGEPKALAKIQQLAEKLKLILSANSEASASIESLISDIDFRVTITRQEFEETLKPFSDDFIQPIRNALYSYSKKSEIAINDLSGVILAGGSSRVPFVQQSLSKIIPENKILKSVNADEAVVNGVTVRGVKLFDAFKTKPLNITERSIFEYSLSHSNGDSQVIFEKGSQYPNATQVLIPIQNTDLFKMDFYENDKIVSNITVQPISSFTDEKCKGGIYLNMTVELNEIRVLNTKSVQTICLKEELGAKSVYEVINENGDKSSKLSIEYPDYVEDNVVIEPLTSKERIDFIDLLRDLDLKDKKRFQLQESKNSLESTLYDARAFLTEEEVIANGPPAQLKKLSEMVSSYLNWLEDESDNAAKKDLNKKKKEVSALLKKIKLYLESVGEPLDLDQFTTLLEKSEDIMKKFENYDKLLQEGLSKLEETIPSNVLNVREEFENVKLTIGISKSLFKWNETLTTLRETTLSIKQIVAANSFAKLQREELYEMKTSLDKLIEAADTKVKALKSAADYRINEVKAVYARKLRVAKRKEERRKKSLEKALANNGTASDNELTSAAESMDHSKVRTTAQSESNAKTKTKTELVNDEL